MTAAIDRRSFLVSLPALVAAQRLLAQSGGPTIKVNGLSQLTLTVSDPRRSIDFYQGLFGMPIQARQGTTTLLRIGAGPKFLAIVPAGPNERPNISRFGMGVESFDVDAVLKVLAAHGVTPADPADTTSASGGPMKVRVVNRGGTREVFVGDPAGIVFQLHDVSYCGGGGPLGNMCRAEASPKKGLIAVKDMSHFTIAANSGQFYQDVFAFGVQVMQAATPGYGVGPGVHFLMFTGGGGARGAAPVGGRGAAAPATPAAGANTGAAPAAAGGAPGAGGRGGAPAVARIDHACMSLEGFNSDAIIRTLADYGIKPSARAGAAGGPMTSWVSMRLENRGGAPGAGTPELYFSDPDDLHIQLQDTTYCGGGGLLGEICPA